MREYKEMIEHMLSECNEEKQSEEDRMSVLNGDGRGLTLMKEVW